MSGFKNIDFSLVRAKRLVREEKAQVDLVCVAVIYHGDEKIKAMTADQQGRLADKFNFNKSVSRKYLVN